MRPDYQPKQSVFEGRDCARAAAWLVFDDEILVIAGERGTFTDPSGKVGALLHMTKRLGRTRRGTCRWADRLTHDIHGGRQTVHRDLIGGSDSRRAVDAPQPQTSADQT